MLQLRTWLGTGLALTISLTGCRSDYAATPVQAPGTPKPVSKKASPAKRAPGEMTIAQFQERIHRYSRDFGRVGEKYAPKISLLLASVNQAKGEARNQLKLGAETLYAFARDLHRISEPMERINPPAELYEWNNYQLQKADETVIGIEKLADAAEKADALLFRTRADEFRRRNLEMDKEAGEILRRSGFDPDRFAANQAFVPLK